MSHDNEGRDEHDSSSVAGGGGGPTRSGSNKKRKTEPSCQVCYARKIKCDKQKPSCGSCVKRGTQQDCIYIDRREMDPAHLPPPRGRVSYNPGQPGGSGGPAGTDATASSVDPAMASAVAAMVHSGSHSSSKDRNDWTATNADPGRTGAWPRAPPTGRASSPPRSMRPSLGLSVPSLTASAADASLRSQSSEEAMIDRIADAVFAKLQRVLPASSASSTLPNPGGVGGSRDAVRLRNSSVLFPPLPTLPAGEEVGPAVIAEQAWAQDQLLQLPKDADLDYVVRFFIVSGRLNAY